MQNNSKSTYILIAIIVILLIIGAYLIGTSHTPNSQSTNWSQYPTPQLNNGTTTNPQNQTTPQSNTSNSTLTGDQQNQTSQSNTNSGQTNPQISTANWQNYTNTQHGFSFLYPNTWSQWGNSSEVVCNIHTGATCMFQVDFMDTVSQGIERTDGNNNQIAAAKDHLHVEDHYDSSGVQLYNDELSDYNNSKSIFAQNKSMITVAGQTELVGEVKDTSTINQEHGTTMIPTDYMYVWLLNSAHTGSVYLEFDTPLGTNDATEIANFEQLLQTFQFQ